MKIIPSETIQLSKKASQHIVDQLKQPKEPNEFLKLAKHNYQKNIKNGLGQFKS